MPKDGQETRMFAPEPFSLALQICGLLVEHGCQDKKEVEEVFVKATEVMNCRSIPSSKRS